MLIRRAVSADLKQLSGLLYQVAAVHHEGRPDLFRAASKKYTDDQLLSLLKDESRPVFVGEENGKLLCHLFCVVEEVKDSPCLCDRRTLYIDDLCVDEQCRGQHIGTALFAFVKAFAKDSGCYNVTLNVWACNESAKRFYDAQRMKPQKYGMETIL